MPLCAWEGVSKWLSQVHGFGTDEWLMRFMNKMTPRPIKGVAVTFCLSHSGIIRKLCVCVCERISLATHLNF